MRSLGSLAEKIKLIEIERSLDHQNNHNFFDKVKARISILKNDFSQMEDTDSPMVNYQQEFVSLTRQNLARKNPVNYEIRNQRYLPIFRPPKKLLVGHMRC